MARLISAAQLFPTGLADCCGSRNIEMCWTNSSALDLLERSSAERQRFLGISKAGSRVLRFLLVEAAHAAIRKDAELRRFYQRLAERHGRPKAKVAVSRKL